MADAGVEIGLAGLRNDHPATQAALGELMGDLRSDPRLEARERSAAIAGGKGVPVELIVSLSTSGTAAALARIVKLWLQRDRRRSVKVSLRTAAGETIISVDGDEISTETLTKALESAARWQGPSDEAQQPGGPPSSAS
jgi:hypothetical protein